MTGNTAKPKEWTAGEMLALSSAYWQPFALQAGVVLDVFTALDEMAGPGKTAAIPAVAARLGCNERSFGMLVSALASLGFLGMNDGGITLPEASRKYLSRNSGDFIGYIIEHHTHLTEGWSKLAEAVRTGGRTRHSSVHTTDEAEREAFLMGMFNVAMNQAERIAAALDLSGKKHLLDLGGGPGTYAVFFCKANPGMAATIFDRPASEKFARGIVGRFGLEDRIDFRGGDFLLDSLPRGYDVAWLSQVLHGETPEGAAKLVTRATQSLDPGGILAIQEFILDDDRAGPPHSALFGLNMLVGTQGGQTYTWSEITAMMRDAGAKDIRRLAVDLPQGCGILVGTKA